MNKRNTNKIESPAFMYIISVVMFILLSFTVIAYLNEVMTVNSKNAEEQNNKISQSENLDIKSQVNYSQQPVAKRKAKTNRHYRYRNEYKAYEQEMKYRQKLLMLQKENAQLRMQQKRNQQLAQIEHNMQKLRQNIEEENRHIPQQIKKQEYPQKQNNKLIDKVMEKSLCDKDSATAVVYFFHPNNSEPVELIFNNEQPDKRNNVKMIFGDLPRAKKHILKTNYADLASLLNKPKYSTSRSKTVRNDVIMKISAGVTTACTPYVYKSEDFYVTDIPVAKQSFGNRENYCKSQNSRLADSLELISLVLTGRFPAGYYWTTSKSYKLNPNATDVKKNSLTQTNEYLLMDYDHSTIGFLTHTAAARMLKVTAKDVQAYSVCVIDE